MDNDYFSLPLSRRAGLLSPPGTSSMRSKANALKEAGVHIVNFAAGELSFDACEDMRVGAGEAIQNGRNRYTPPIGLPALRSALAERMTKRCNTRYSSDEVAVTSGAKQALFNAALLVLDPGDEVIIPTPHWETFPTQVRLAQANPIFVDTRSDNFKLTAVAVKRAITDRTKMIIINTPNNPTGAVYRADELQEIAKIAFEKSIWVLFDECYQSFIHNPNQHHNIVKLFEPIKRQTILVDSFSKSYAVTGWRAGYACGPSEIISAMHNLQGHTTSNPNSLAQYAALHTLTNESGTFLAEVKRFLACRLEGALGILNSIDGISYAPPEGAFYLYVDVSQQLNRSFMGRRIPDVDSLCELLLTEAHIAVVPGTASGDPRGTRMTYCLEPDELRIGLERFRNFLLALS